MTGACSVNGDLSSWALIPLSGMTEAILPVTVGVHVVPVNYGEHRVFWASSEACDCSGSCTDAFDFWRE